MEAEQLKGHLDGLILAVIAGDPKHGYAVIEALKTRSMGRLSLPEGTVYPALHRLIKRRWISVEEGISENNRRAKFYALTAQGKRQLAAETSKWDKMARAIAQVLRPGTQEGA